MLVVNFSTLIMHVPTTQVFKQPWPGVMRTVYGNHQRFETTYFKKFPGYYVTGDGDLCCDSFSVLQLLRMIV